MKNNSTNMKNLSFLQRNKRKLIILASLSTLVFATGSIFIYFMKTWLYKQQLKITEQHFIREQIRRRFTQTQHDSLIVLYELLPVFILVMAKHYDLEELVFALRDKKLKKTLSNSNTDDNNTDKKNEIKSESSLPGGTLSSALATNDTSPSEPVLINSAPDSNSKFDEMSKAQLWHYLQMKSITKVITISYTISSLFLLTRLQLNILTRREYLDTAVNVAIEQEKSKNENKISTNSIVNWISGFIFPNFTKKNDTNGSKNNQKKEGIMNQSDTKSEATYINEQAFLSTSWWLLNNGSVIFSELVEEEVTKIFQNYNPKDTITLIEFSNKLTDIFHSINKKLFTVQENTELVNSNPTVSDIFLPEDSKIEYVLQRTMDEESLKELSKDSSILNQLLAETKEYINNKSSIITLELLINESFQFTMNELEGMVAKKLEKKKKNNSSYNEDNDTDIRNEKLQLALVAMGCKDCCSKMTINNNDLVTTNKNPTTTTNQVRNEFLLRLDTITSLNDLSASVYGNINL